MGLVWEKCETISECRLPASNHTAGHAVLAKQRGLLKDALDELEEAWTAFKDDDDDDADFGAWDERESQAIGSGDSVRRKDRAPRWAPFAAPATDSPGGRAPPGTKAAISSDQAGRPR